jgi:integrase
VVRQRANGEGTVYPRRNKQGKIISYRASYWARTASGGLKRRYVSGKTKTEALSALRKATVDRDGGLVFEVENITLAEYLDRWLNGPVKTKNLKAITYEQYQRQVRVHIVPSLGRVKLRNLSPELVQDLYDSKIAAGLKPASVRYIHAVLHNALEHAHKRRLIPENAASKTEPPKVRPPEIQPLDAEQTRTLLDAARTEPLGGLYVVAVTSGLRIGELLALRWMDVDLEQGVMRVSRTLSRAKGGPRFTTPKNGKGRPVTLTREAVEALRSHRKDQNEVRLKLGTLWEDNGLIFASETGAPLTRDFVDRRSFKPLLKRARLPEKRLHDLRHTCATLLLGQGVHPTLVQKLLGHASVVMTLNRYSHWMPSMGDQTARAMEAALR